MRATLLLLALAACGKSHDTPPPPPAVENVTTPTPDIVKGTMTIDGKAIAASEMQCKPGAALHIFVDVVTPGGTLRMEDGKLSLDGEPLTCEKLDRSWGGGRRPNNDAYWRGTLAFKCVKGPTHVDGDLDLDCGHITAEERGQLDAQRTKARAGSAS